jgi:hypothetical protein
VTDLLFCPTPECPNSGALLDASDFTLVFRDTDLTCVVCGATVRPLV